MLRERANWIHNMFARAAGRYDLINRVITLGQDQSWRRRVARLADPQPDGIALDAASGTGLLALELTRLGASHRIVALDFCHPMLELAARRLSPTVVCPVLGNILALPFGDDTFDCVTIGFGLRNMVDLHAALRELRRVVKPGHPVVSLETTYPISSPLAPLVNLYWKLGVPLLAQLFGGDRDAYRHLIDSVMNFLSPEELASAMKAAGFRQVYYEVHTFGSVMIHVATK